MFKSFALFCLKSAVFSAIFWGMWLGIIRPMTSTQQEGRPSAQDAQASAQMEAAQKYMDRANRQLDMVEDQQRRTDQYLTLQEDTVKRMAAVVAVWEKQSGLQGR